VGYKNNDIIVKKCNQTVPMFDNIQYVDYIGLFENYTTICVVKGALGKGDLILKYPYGRQ